MAEVADRWFGAFRAIGGREAYVVDVLSAPCAGTNAGRSSKAKGEIREL